MTLGDQAAHYRRKAGATMTSPPVLHVWEDADSDMWVVASSADDAWAAFLECMGGTRDDYHDMDWCELADDHVMHIWLDNPPSGGCDCAARGAAYKATCDAYNEACAKYVRLMGSAGLHRLPKGTIPPAPQPKDSPGPYGHYHHCPVGHPGKTCAEWARENGRGLLCSTEF